MVWLWLTILDWWCGKKNTMAKLENLLRGRDSGMKRNQAKDFIGGFSAGLNFSGGFCVEGPSFLNL